MPNPWRAELYGNYRNRKFTDIWVDSDSFLNDYKSNGIGQPFSKENTATTLYYLLYARYGNSTIASSDENQFKYKVFALIFMYGPTWEKRLDVQEKVRALSEDELREGGKSIYNTALNPSTEPSTSSLEELQTINTQNTANRKRSKLDAYSTLVALLETDVTAYFLDRFRELFLKVVAPELPLWYETESEGDD